MTHHPLKLGKKPARPGAITFSFAEYVKSKLPTPPANFGHASTVKSWGVLANDSVGDCVIAGGCHETMLWNAETGNFPRFDDATAVKNYSAITGYNPADSNSDQGTDMQAAASYRRKHGLIDADGKKHQIAAYLGLTPRHVGEHKTAAWMLGAVGIGIAFPDYAMDQFNAGQPWDYKPHGKIEGGHYVPMVGFDGEDFLIVTWGKVQRMTAAFFQHYNDESVAYVSCEMLSGGRSPEGFYLADLQADLKQLKGVA